jgi:poly-gamma-glutamate synthesis protein (capsule biosynthesis protein)
MQFSFFSKMINWVIGALVLALGLFLFFTFPNSDGTRSANIYEYGLKNNTGLVSKSNPKNTSPDSLPIIALDEPDLNLLFFGDLMLDRNVAARLKGKTIDFLLGELASSSNLAQFDLVGANLEGAVTNQGDHYSPMVPYDFAFVPERIKELKDYGFSYFSLANNHITDQGQIGLAETRDNLNNLNFYFSGDADAKVSADSLRIIEIKNQKIALVSLSMVYNNFDLAAAKKLINESREQVDWIIVNIHWGNEYQHNFNVWQQNMGRELIDAGADLIIGHHPHVVQGMEIYKNRPIFYSLGNFIFDQYFSADTQVGLGLKVNLNKDKIIITLWPLQSVKSAVKLMPTNEKVKFLENFSLWSEGDLDLKTQIKGEIINIAK